MIGRFCSTARFDLFDGTEDLNQSPFQWFEFQYNGKRAGELLAAFELIEINSVSRVDSMFATFLILSLDEGPMARRTVPFGPRRDSRRSRSISTGNVHDKHDEKQDLRNPVSIDAGPEDLRN